MKSRNINLACTVLHNGQQASMTLKINENGEIKLPSLNVSIPGAQLYPKIKGFLRASYKRSEEVHFSQIWTTTINRENIIFKHQSGSLEVQVNFFKLREILRKIVVSKVIAKEDNNRIVTIFLDDRDSMSYQIGRDKEVSFGIQPHALLKRIQRTLEKRKTRNISFNFRYWKIEIGNHEEEIIFKHEKSKVTFSADFKEFLTIIEKVCN